MNFDHDVMHAVAFGARAVEADLNDVFENVRSATKDTAEEVAAKVNQVINNPPPVQESFEKAGEQAKQSFETVKDTMAENSISLFTQAKAKIVSFLRGTNYEIHWSFLLPFFFALVALRVTWWYVGGAFANSNPRMGRSGYSIPLFMMLGDKIVRKALAVGVATPRCDAPLFGCGWLSYSLSTLTPAFAGTRDLLPKPEVKCKVLNLESGQGRANDSFVLARVLRDLELRQTVTQSLVVEILDAGEPKPPLSWRSDVYGNRHRGIQFIQLFFAVKCYWHSGDLSVLLLLVTATLLMKTVANMPAWRAHKFSARKDGGKNAAYALLRGNGYPNVFIIRNTHKEAWDLEDLAGAPTSYDYDRTWEDMVLPVVVMAFFGLASLSLTLSEGATIHMIGVMIMGTLGNLYTAALYREPWAHGVNLESVEVILNGDIMAGLQQLEEKYPGLGEPLVKEFFPGGLREDEKAWWIDLKQKREQEKALQTVIEKDLVEETAEDITTPMEEDFEDISMKTMAAEEIQDEMTERARGEATK